MAATRVVGDCGDDEVVGAGGDDEVALARLKRGVARASEVIAAAHSSSSGAE